MDEKITDSPAGGFVPGRKDIMKAKVTIEKSFDEGKEFTKEYVSGDFADFFNEEGAYLDRLSDVMKDRGESGDKFMVTYTITLVK